MQHPDEATIHTWLDGALTAEEAARVDAHVKECAQCQAAVAEARGFIAASSRILTALDNVPRGVIPAAAATRRVQPWVWRVAATVLVVASATLVFVERKDIADTAYRGKAVSVPMSDTGAAVFRAADSVAVSEPTASLGAKNAPAIGSAVTPQAVPSAPPATAEQSPQPSAQRMKSAAATKAADDIREVQPERAAGLGQRRVEASDRNRLDAAAQNAAPTLLSSPGLTMDVAETIPRAVATKRTIGKTETFYELAPGDTVVLEEQFNVQLEGVVTTGAALKRAQPLPGRAAGQAAAAPETQQKAVPAAAPPPPVALQDAESSEIHRVSWLDRSSGRVLILSGRHSQQELERIRAKIQELRDAAQPKKNPE
jgi:hypothetical protein